jgi:hypothetical protein
MSNDKTILIKHDIEEITQEEEGLKKIDNYDELLKKGDNIKIIFKDDKSFNLIHYRSLIKICNLINAIPEEIIVFRLYLVKQKEKTIDVPDDYKQSILMELIKNNKDNNVSKIALNPEFFYKTWINFYKFLLVFLIIIFFGCFIYLINYKSLNFLFLLDLVLLCIIFYTYYIGTKKLELKKIKEFNKENNLLYCIGACSLINILSTKVSFISGSGFKYMNDHLLLVIFIFLCLIILDALILILNKNMMEFYTKYEKEINEGKLLMDIDKENLDV